ncbi:hypothetical protein TcWFU_009463 [Taenia crassiceps]|uniref:Uncharacterized protein n=1 Tax=Taenia crassiceps TaxID=6207 RepID=A0ABR4QI25_9CEST
MCKFSFSFKKVSVCYTNAGERLVDDERPRPSAKASHKHQPDHLPHGQLSLTICPFYAALVIPVKTGLPSQNRPLIDWGAPTRTVATVVGVIDSGSGRGLHSLSLPSSASAQKSSYQMSAARLMKLKCSSRIVASFEHLRL